MIAKLDIKTLVISVISLFFPILIFSQESSEDSNSREELIQKAKFYELRGANAIDAAIGTSVINGDFVDPEFEIYSHIGFKRHITPYFAVDLGYHKFNLAYIDIYNEGFMSFDLNLDVTVFPYKRFSPFIFAGGGLNASNHFQQTAGKLQGGGGVEYIFTDTVGIKLYTDYNFVF
ncbi:MAG: hypothetical protein HRU26_03905, partial [Psychroserpens sp.]|nr:hypothetical protein [Psychroserpens sp.]